MVKTIVDSQKGFQWVDILSPSPDEVKSLAEKYGFMPESVEDVLEPEHLPKYEQLEGYTLIILRYYNVTRESDADTVRELTNKLAIFMSDKYVLTIHLNPWTVLEKISTDAGSRFEDPKQVLCFLATAVLRSFEEPAGKLNRSIDYFEEHVFFKNRITPLLKSLYFLKRKVEVVRSILQQTNEVIEYIDPPGSTDAAARNVRDLFVRQSSIFVSLTENTNQLLTVYFNISAQRTNEIIRVLTIFSVFFMPLTFIVGVYGMNFDFMPELRSRFGYPAVWLLMLLVVTGIYFWFKRKKWL